MVLSNEAQKNVALSLTLGAKIVHEKCANRYCIRSGAAAVIGGLITSTILSLLVTPSFFSIVDDIEHFVGIAKNKVKRLFGKPTTQSAAGT